MEKFEKRRPSRKQKSLGLLCQKFLARYPSYPLSAEKTTISLDEVAVSLGMYCPVRSVSRYSGTLVSWGRPSKRVRKGPGELPSVVTIQRRIAGAF